MSVCFRSDAARRDAEKTGGEDKRAIGAGQRFAKGFDGESVGIGSCLKVPAECEIVFEREMNDAV